MNVKRKSSWILLFAAMLLTSCSNSTVYDDETFFINFDAGGGEGSLIINSLKQSK